MSSVPSPDRLTPDRQRISQRGGGIRRVFSAFPRFGDGFP